MIDIHSCALLVEYGLLGSESESDLMDTFVVVIPYIRPKHRESFSSRGTVLCVSGEEGMDLLSPPLGAQPGASVSIPGLKVYTEQKTIYWKQDSKRMTVSYTAQLTYSDKPLRTSRGALIVPPDIKVQLD